MFKTVYKRCQHVWCLGNISNKKDKQLVLPKQSATTATTYRTFCSTLPLWLPGPWDVSSINRLLAEKTMEGSCLCGTWGGGSCVVFSEWVFGYNFRDLVKK